MSAAGEYRYVYSDYKVDQVSQYGATRSAPIAATEYETKAYEFGLEARIPIFSKQFTVPFIKNWEFNPAIRWSKQDGSAPSYINLSGVNQNPKFDGDVATIWSLATTLQPIQDVTLRGNITRSIRQPDGLELFLGGQPAFTSVTDPCTTGNIGQGPNPAQRKKNCAADVIKMGYATTEADALDFLSKYTVGNTSSSQGARFGNAGLKPERGESWTIGMVLKPRFIPHLTIAADYINLILKDSITRVSAAALAQYCYDSSAYPNTKANYGVNTCEGFVRYNSSQQPALVNNAQNNLAFGMADGWQSTYLNLAQYKVRATNITADYWFNVDDALKLQKDLGRVSFKTNIYHLIQYAYSGDGLWDDTQYVQGSVGSPKWQASTNLSYSLKKWRATWNWYWTDHQRYFSGGLPITIENDQYMKLPPYSIHNAAVAYDINDKVTVRVNVNNVFDKLYVLKENGTLASSQGRNYQVTVYAKF